jgi:lactoylglutathione lyase
MDNRNSTGRTLVGTWVTGVGAITLFVDDLSVAKSFYQKMFGLPVVFEDEDSAVFQFPNTMINLLKDAAARELIDPGTVAGSAGGNRFQLTMWVENTDAVCAELGALGVSLLNGPMDRSWGQRTASFTDPDGHLWEIAQELPRSEAS